MTATSSEVTEVIATDVRAGKEDAYQAWAQRVEAAQAKFPGYLGSFVQPPRDGERSWTTLMRFDSLDHLQAWMSSSQRAALLAERADLVEREMLHRLDNSFPGWIPADPVTGKAPNPWKTASLVLLTLYPVVMLELRFLTPLLNARHLPPGLATFIGNAISVALTTWPLMPLAIRAFRSWIFPDRASPRMRVLAPLIVAICYAIELAVLWNLLS